MNYFTVWMWSWSFVVLCGSFSTWAKADVSVQFFTWSHLTSGCNSGQPTPQCNEKSFSLWKALARNECMLQWRGWHNPPRGQIKLQSHQRNGSCRRQPPCVKGATGRKLPGKCVLVSEYFPAIPVHLGIPHRSQTSLPVLNARVAFIRSGRFLTSRAAPGIASAEKNQMPHLSAETFLREVFCEWEWAWL